ncbi:heterokaryon incompatibility protein-domain-containing protein, partial [Rhexocercosporidium sp. MPI-PUGE-AT-0058]
IPSSEGCFSLTKSWFDECQVSHSKCQANLEPRLPSRVVCFDDDSGNDEFNLRVHESAADERGAYIFLSYQWGGVQPLTARSSNMLDVTKDISLEMVPVTWRDAFIVARRLGIKYLWIDALCIIQDSQDDWAREASRMSDYISNATFVLAAGFGSNSYAGLFEERRVEDLASLVYNTESTNGHWSGGVVHLRRPLGETREAILKTPLAKRAWTMQESVLPERLLYYGSEQMYWNCQEHALAEGSAFPERPIWNLASQMRVLSTQPNPSSSSSPLLLNPWYDLVQEFSARVLTVRRDVFPAIASIAQMFETSGGRYLAGLWQNDLHRGLLWNASKFSQGERREYIAPSWSWASLDTPVHYEIVKGIRLPIDPRNSAAIIDVRVENSKSLLGIFYSHRLHIPVNTTEV